MVDNKIAVNNKVANNFFEIEVAYANEQEQIILKVQVTSQFSVKDAIILSGISKRFPEIDLAHNSVGVFSEPRELAAQLKPGERIEIYRELAMDPKEARKKRALFYNFKLGDLPK